MNKRIIEQSGNRPSRSECDSMDPARTDFLQRIAVLLRSIPFVLFEIVLRVMPGEASHNPVTEHLGDNTGCCNRPGLFITANDGLEGDSGLSQPDGVDQEKLRSDTQASDGPEHGKARGVEDVDRVDFFGRGTSDPYGNRA